MTITTYPLSGIEYDSGANPLVGATVEALLVDRKGRPAVDNFPGFGSAAPVRVTATTDGSGAWTLNLPSNLDGNQDLRFRIRLTLEGQTEHAWSQTLQMPRDGGTVSALVDGSPVTPTPESAAAAEVAKARAWAVEPENELVPSSAGGNGADEFSARHYAAKTAADAQATSADAQATGEDRAATSQHVLDAVQARSDALSSADSARADADQVAQDRIETGQHVTTTSDNAEMTSLDRIATGEDRLATGEDRTATAEDRDASALSAAAAGEWASSTAPVGVEYGGDGALKGARGYAQDAQSAADAVQADRAATGMAAEAAAVNAAATGQDRIATAEDRAATAEDRAAVEASVGNLAIYEGTDANGIAVFTMGGLISVAPVTVDGIEYFEIEFP